MRTLQNGLFYAALGGTVAFILGGIGLLFMRDFLQGVIGLTAAAAILILSLKKR